MYLDADSGFMGRWSRDHVAADDESETLVTYLEGVADMIEAPGLAVGDTSGVVDGALVRLSGIDPERENRRRPWTG
ncbi:hypothetical protein [uncultured Streptomyces sp.]|uniref:hypothetical protein n=1 Tax=uncultured Streptomyces sp. TaxID=174707 RepID=UPI0026327D7D|nr:hypothetical protein [uncultured Streptomyces sp.]